MQELNPRGLFTQGKNLLFKGELARVESVADKVQFSAVRIDSVISPVIKILIFSAGSFPK